MAGLTRSAALEYGDKGLCVNAVGLAFIHTPMIERLEQDPASLQRLIARHRWAVGAAPRRGPRWYCGWPRRQPPS